jgi:hypothetical protein
VQCGSLNYVRLAINMQMFCDYVTYMKSRLIEKYVMLLMVDLQKLTGLVRTLSSESLDIELWSLRRLKVNFRPSCHICECTIACEASLKSFACLIVGPCCIANA